MPVTRTSWAAPLRGTTSADPGRGVPRFTLAQKLETGIKEASDVVALPGGQLLVAGDTSGKLGLVGTDGRTTKVALEGLPGHKPSQFEGIAYDPNRHHLLLSREESREIIRYEWNPAKAKANDPKLEKTFSYKKALGGPQNKGLEGLVWVSGEDSPTGRPVLIAAKEGKPRELVLFDDGGGGKPMRISLDQAVRDACGDLSAIAIDPVTGHLFVSSDESASVAQLELTRKGDGVQAKLVQSFDLKGDGGKPLARIEGLTFDARGDLFVLTENDGVLRRYARQ